MPRHGFCARCRRVILAVARLERDFGFIGYHLSIIPQQSPWLSLMPIATISLVILISRIWLIKHDQTTVKQ